MQSWPSLPDTPLRAGGPLSAEIRARGVTDFRSAGRYLQALPYGRTRDRADFQGVLTEGRGTCSTKHALLAAVALEQRVPVRLTLGIYMMSERNTPGVGAVLGRHGLDAIPEAHCYLTHDGLRIDVTRTGAEPSEPIAEFLHEETIVPEQIGDHKVAVHRAFMRRWVGDHPELVGGRSFEDVWTIREACVAALAQ